MKLSEPSTKISAADRIDTNNVFEENEDFSIDIDGWVWV